VKPSGKGKHLKLDFGFAIQICSSLKGNPQNYLNYFKATKSC
jgi:hypothetical protein